MIDGNKRKLLCSIEAYYTCRLKVKHFNMKYQTKYDKQYDKYYDYINTTLHYSYTQIRQQHTGWSPGHSNGTGSSLISTLETSHGHHGNKK